MFELALPTLAVLLGASYAPRHSFEKPWVSTIFAMGFLLLLCRYLSWRFVVTVLPAAEWSFHALVVWIVFLVEVMAWSEMALLIMVILRRTDRSAQADAYERHFAGLPDTEYPRVDVFIATYNEPLEVLEKTIAGAVALKWPRERLNVFVLDDGRRDWLRAYCEARGVTHLTRDNSRNAKAGNINAALERTNGEFILVLDADFVPNSRMLLRAVGFFDDPKVGIVQMPHFFFNGDPIQTSLNIRSDLPDEQRFFFDVIQPGRDGWDCAFCCGSNGIIRRAALDSIGGQMPTQSITEDMLLTLALMRKGYVTRYLNERLAIGLAPENLQAYFIQRARWAQGALQIMFLKHGPLGPGLPPVARVLFMPSHWITQSICQPVAICVPAFFLLTGIPPIINARLEDIFFYQVPTVAAGLALMTHLAPNKFAALSSTAQSVLQAFRILPVLVSTLLNPSGHTFKVTPKGQDARVGEADRFTIRISLIIFVLTGVGLLLNANFGSRIISGSELLPVVAFWAVVNMIVLLVVIVMAIPRPIHRAEERFEIEEPCAIRTRQGMIPGETLDLSASGARLRTGPTDIDLPDVSDWIGLELAGVGVVPAIIRRVIPDEGSGLRDLAAEIILPSGIQRDRLIQKIFVYGAPPMEQSMTGRLPVTLRMLAQLLKRDLGASAATVQSADSGPEIEPPAWLLDCQASKHQDWFETDLAEQLATATFDAPVQRTGSTH